MVLNIFQMIATRVFLTALECTKTFSTGTPPRTLLGKLTALPRLPRWFKGLQGRGGEGEEKGEGKRRVIWSGRDRPPYANS